jgi:uncharacterized protein (DUF1330 family)
LCACRIIGKLSVGGSNMKSQYMMGLTLLSGIAIGALAMEGLHAQTKLKAYSVGEIEPIAGATLSPSYLDNIRKEINKSHGRSLRTLNGKIFPIEGAPAPTKLAIVEWDSADDAKAFYNSKAWTDLAPERNKAQKTIRRYIVEVEP